jgi:hypothetical protein
MTRTVLLAEKLNQDCECAAADVSALRRHLGFVESHAHLFSDIPVFVADAHVRQMEEVIFAVERVTSQPAFREEVLARAPATARIAPGQRGVFFGYDFHIGRDGPRLIEINTNAGGALLNVELLRMQQDCCAPVVENCRPAGNARAVETAIGDMFVDEWRRARSTPLPRTIAIVDDDPVGQYLYPEFQLARSLFESRGLRTIVVDAAALTVDDFTLTYEGTPIDLVYNRSTDFYFDDPAHDALREALERDLAVITPHPHAHALYSSKRNLVIFSDPAKLASLGATGADVETLVHAVPPTLCVDDPGQRWWDERKRWFFKPEDGFGSRGTYRGDKITRRAFSEVMRGTYIAQQVSPPSERRRFKLDVRCYAYAGRQQLLAARLYQGQTTNFRSAGGGFAPVYVVGAAAEPR